MLPVIENVSTIEEMMDMIHQPMFLLDAYGANQFAFRRLNQCHQQITGMDESQIMGQKPHDVLPTRLADTVLSNYEKCRLAAAPHTYEELLELPNGVRWWQTTLSPVKDASGHVVKVVGLAVDITDRKEREFDASRKLAEMTRLNEDLQVFAASVTQTMAGPFETIDALLDMVRDGFVDLGDEKLGQLQLCQDIARQAIEKMTVVLQATQDLNISCEAPEAVDFHHLASDMAALLDPHNHTKMHLPSVSLETDRVALQMILRKVMESAVRYADSEITVSVQNGSNHTVAIIVADDGVGQSNVLRCDGQAVLPSFDTQHGSFGLASAGAIAHSRGGEMVRAKSPYPTGAAIKFTLPGRIL